MNIFRAWDTEREVFGEVYSLTRIEQALFMLIKYKDNNIAEARPRDVLIIEQYTGLEDKNLTDDFIGNIWEVEFRGKKIRFVREVELTWQGYVFDFRCLDGQISPVHANVSEDGIIVGNIHEKEKK